MSGDRATLPAYSNKKEFVQPPPPQASIIELVQPPPPQANAVELVQPPPHAMAEDWLVVGLNP